MYEKILVAKKIITMDKENPVANWVAINGKKIVDIGTGVPPKNAEKVIDVGDETVVTGLIDSHVHAMVSALFAKCVDLSKATSAQEILKVVEDECKKSDGELVACVNYLPMLLKDGVQPYREDLDKVSNGKAVILVNLTMHGSTLNSKAYEYVNIPFEKMLGVVPEKGLLDSDDAHFYATGKLFQLISDEMLSSAADDFIAHGLSLGITGMHCLEGEFLALGRELDMWFSKMDTLPMHLVLYPQVWDYDFAKKYNLPRYGGCLTLDGSDVEWTMALQKPYSNRPETRGLLLRNDGVLYDAISKASADEKQCSFHAMGDRAIDQIIYLYDRVIKEHGDKKLRHRIEHFTLATDEQIEMAANLGVVVSPQPEYMYLFGGPEGHLESYFGTERNNQMETYKKWIDAGLVVACGSDSPVNRLNPLYGIHSLVNISSPLRKLSVEEALMCYTWNCAYAAHEEDERGSTTIGKYADFTVLDRDPYKEPEEIMNFKVTKTIVEGEVVFDLHQQL